MLRFIWHIRLRRWQFVYLLPLHHLNQNINSWDAQIIQHLQFINQVIHRETKPVTANKESDSRDIISTHNFFHHFDGHILLPLSFKFLVISTPYLYLFIEFTMPQHLLDIYSYPFGDLFYFNNLKYNYKINFNY